MNRRQLIIGSAASAVLVACAGSSGSSNSEGGSNDGTPGLAPVQLIPGFDAQAINPGVLAAGRPQRAPFVLLESDGVPLTDGPDNIEIVLTDASGSTVGTYSAAKHDIGIPNPYYPLLFTVDAAGTYTASTSVDGIDSNWNFSVAEAGNVPLAQIGDQMVPVPTPTEKSPLDTAPLCTRKPACAFHGVSHADTVGTGRPTALLVSTPAFCQTVICGPVLDLLITESEARPDMDFVHAEVYKDAEAIGNVSGATLTEAVTIVGAGLFEPTLIVTDGDGMVTARLDFTFDRDELAEALASAS